MLRVSVVAVSLVLMVSPAWSNNVPADKDIRKIVSSVAATCATLANSEPRMEIQAGGETGLVRYDGKSYSVPLIVMTRLWKQRSLLCLDAKFQAGATQVVVRHCAKWKRGPNTAASKINPAKYDQRGYAVSVGSKKSNGAC